MPKESRYGKVNVELRDKALMAGTDSWKSFPPTQTRGKTTEIAIDWNYDLIRVYAISQPASSEFFCDLQLVL